MKATHEYVNREYENAEKPFFFFKISFNEITPKNITKSLPKEIIQIFLQVLKWHYG